MVSFVARAQGACTAIGGAICFSLVCRFCVTRWYNKMRISGNCITVLLVVRA